MIIIPDTHGRKFWKNAVKQVKENEKIIFLGDYVDPYNGEIDATTKEVITKDSALANFKDIIEFAKNNSNVILLLGNHDTEYFLGTTDCRADNEHWSEIADLFDNNIDLFRLGYHETIDDKKYVFTHTCITQGWVKSCFYIPEDCEDSPQLIVDELNKYLKAYDYPTLKVMLDDISYARGGMCQFGSPIWADCGEYNSFDWENTDTYFIFGHTQQSIDPIIEDDYAMLDCRKAFRLENNEIKPLVNEND